MARLKQDIIKQLAELKGLTTYHYKVIMYLMSEKETTQAKAAEDLEVRKQNIHKVFKDLNSMNIIKISRTEGKNIYWDLNPKPTFQMKGQLKLEI